ncbi:unnamed protein product [Rotaria magnacalcarata]
MFFFLPTCYSFCFSILVPLTTSIRHLHGELKRISIDNIELHSNSIFKRATLNKVQSNMVPLFQTLSVFLFPPSLITLTTPMAMIENVSSSFCSIDDAYQRDMIISFADGSHVNIIERVSDKRIEFNGSYPDNYEFKNSTFFTETMVQTDSASCSHQQHVSVFFQCISVL